MFFSTLGNLIERGKAKKKKKKNTPEVKVPSQF